MSDIRKLASKIDLACDRNDHETLNETLDEIGKINLKPLSPVECATLNYFIANAHSGIRRSVKQKQNWLGDQHHREKEILHLRLALSDLGELTDEEIRTDLKSRITTNLANALNNIGRFVEAIQLWDQTLISYPYFPMAMGNKASTMFEYARYASKGYVQAIFLQESYKLLKSALEIGVEKQARNEMSALADHINTFGDWDWNKVEIPLPAYRKGRTKKEKTYRKWCVENQLYLDFLNDVSRDWTSLEDTLTLPNMVQDILEEDVYLPAPYAIFNQLKQEYVSARFLIFEAIQEKDKPLHFSDRCVKLYDALDYRYYRLWVERLKMSFLSIFAIFDKIAYLVNDYWKLEIPVRNLSFQSVWFEDRGLTKIREQFLISENKPLQGLFWLSKDLYYRSKDVQLISPEAKTLTDIRNHIAHKYLRVHDHYLNNPAQERKTKGKELSFPVSDIELVEESIRLLKLARSALIYLTTAITYEESKKSADSNSEYTFPMTIHS